MHENRFSERPWSRMKTKVICLGPWPIYHVGGRGVTRKMRGKSEKQTFQTGPMNLRNLGCTLSDLNNESYVAVIET